MWRFFTDWLLLSGSSPCWQWPWSVHFYGFVGSPLLEFSDCCSLGGVWWDSITLGSLRVLLKALPPSSVSCPFDVLTCPLLSHLLWHFCLLPTSHLTLTSKNPHVLVPHLELLVWLFLPLETAEGTRPRRGDGNSDLIRWFYGFCCLVSLGSTFILSPLLLPSWGFCELSNVFPLNSFSALASQLFSIPYRSTVAQ